MARYLVTGGAGFIGSHIVHRLVGEGQTVRVLDDFSSGRQENLASVASKVEVHKGDLRDRGVVRKAIAGVDYVLHQAAWRSVPKSMSDPYGYTEVNVLGTVSLFEEAAKAKVKRVVLASSSSVYGDSTVMPLREDLPVAPISPYAMSKLSTEHFAQMFTRSFGLETVSLRYFNVFGPRQSIENQYAVVVPKFITCVLRGESPPIHGDGKQSRDFTYVDNVVDVNLLSATTPGVAGRVFNVACGEDHSVLELLEQINKILNKHVKPTFLPTRAGDVRRTLADITAVTTALRWQPKVNFIDGLRRTVDYFKQNPA